MMKKKIFQIFGGVLNWCHKSYKTYTDLCEDLLKMLLPKLQQAGWGGGGGSFWASFQINVATMSSTAHLLPKLNL